MEYSGGSDFNGNLKERTRLFAIQLCNSLKTVPYNQVTKNLISQVVRSGTSVAANFHAATRARSIAEYYSKICIVVEECDETVLWLDLIISAKLITTNEIKDLKQEALELLYIFATVRKKLKHKLKDNTS